MHCLLYCILLYCIINGELVAGCSGLFWIKWINYIQKERYLWFKHYHLNFIALRCSRLVFWLTLNYDSIWFFVKFIPVLLHYTLCAFLLTISTYVHVQRKIISPFRLNDFLVLVFLVDRGIPNRFNWNRIPKYSANLFWQEFESWNQSDFRISDKFELLIWPNFRI